MWRLTGPEAEPRNSETDRSRTRRNQHLVNAPLDSMTAYQRFCHDVVLPLSDIVLGQQVRSRLTELLRFQWYGRDDINRHRDQTRIRAAAFLPDAGTFLSRCIRARRCIRSRPEQTGCARDAADTDQNPSAREFRRFTGHRLHRNYVQDDVQWLHRGANRGVAGQNLPGRGLRYPVDVLGLGWFCHGGPSSADRHVTQPGPRSHHQRPGLPMRLHECFWVDRL